MTEKKTKAEENIKTEDKHEEFDLDKVLSSVTNFASGLKLPMNDSKELASVQIRGSPEFILKLLSK